MLKNKEVITFIIAILIAAVGGCLIWKSFYELFNGGTWSIISIPISFIFGYGVASIREDILKKW